MTHKKEFVGIDVGKDEFFVFSDAKGAAGPFKNNACGFDDLIDWLGASGVERTIALEPTGGHEWALWGALAAAGFDVRQVCASHVHAFARACGQLAKTDRIDAQIIAQFIAFRPDAGRRFPCQNIRFLNALCQKRRQLIAQRKRLKCQICGEDEALFAPINDELMQVLNRHISALERHLEEAIEADPTFKKRAKILRSIPGVGPVLWAILLAQMPELGGCNDKQIAALAGVAPMDRQSGKRDAKRSIRGGRAEVRSVLYQAALVAATHNPKLRAFFQKMKSAGKPHKVALIAVARKLLCIANTLIAKNNMWQAG